MAVGAASTAYYSERRFLGSPLRAFYRALRCRINADNWEYLFALGQVSLNIKEFGCESLRLAVRRRLKDSFVLSRSCEENVLKNTRYNSRIKIFF